MHRRKGIIVAGLVVGLVFLQGCYPFPDEPRANADLDAVVSQFREGVDFNAFSRYYLWDSVAVLVDEGKPPLSQGDVFYQNGIDSLILLEIEVQMDMLGYQRVDFNQNPELGVVATAIISEFTVVVTNPGWWWGYPGYGWWWNSGFGYGYPFYGGGYSPLWYNSYYQHTTGSVIIDMVDLSATEADTAFVWNAIVNGLVDESQTEITGDRIKKGIESAFHQSRNFYEREPGN